MKDAEQILLNNTSLDELIKMRIEQEFKTNGNKPKKTKRIVTELKDCPSEKIFSNDAVFKLFNRLNKTETYINGIQADAMIGIQEGIREKILDKTLTAFSTDDAYVKFEKAYV